ncbi:MAG: AMP-binding protein [Gammaproteobacteria bacterium]|nr:AMP-binding protein [Gammaproteobacteria bacterium]
MSSNLFAAFAAHFPARLDSALLELPGGARLSYADMLAGSGRLATLLTGLGLKRGDRVSVQAEKSVNFLLLYLACLRGGFAFHPLNPGYTPAELQYFLENAEPALFVGDPAASAALALAETLNIPHRYTMDAVGEASLAAAAASLSAEFETVAVAPDDMAALLYSSGTTGRPKGIMLSHANLAANARALAQAWAFTADDVLLHALPVFHVHGLFIALGCTLMSGSRAVWLPRFENAAVLAALPRCTVMMGVPTFYTRLLADPAFTSGLTGNIRVFISGSAPLLSETFSAFEDRIGQRILERYGMTETSVIASNPLHGERRASAVGPTVAGMQIRLVDDAGMPVADGEVGHVQVRGESVFRGYWRMPEKTREDISPEGFFNTGDDGRVDAEGYLYLVGRSKDLIITGGLNVYPSEVEAVLDRLPQVLESAVIALPHPDFGEQVAAVIVPRVAGEFDEAQARAAVKTELAGYKLPKSYLLVDALPRNTMGKVQKNLLRQQFQNGA